MPSDTSLLCCCSTRYLAWPVARLALSSFMNQHPIRIKEGSSTQRTALIPSSDSSSSSANIMRRVGVILFAVLYIMLVGIYVFLWTQTRFIMRYRKQLLKAISIALPFLAIRTLYSVLSTFSSSSFDVTSTTQPNTSDLAKFNIFTAGYQGNQTLEASSTYTSSTST